MGLSAEYVLKETATNLWRNRLMALAAVMTVAISLSLVGVALVIKQGVATATASWQGGVQVAIFMDANASSTETQAVRSELSSMRQIKRFTYVNHRQSFEEFRKLFASEPDVIASMTASEIPPSFRLVLTNPSDASAVGSDFSGTPGVRSVEYAKQAVQSLERVTQVIQIVVLAVALALMISAIVLVLNAIRMAIFARRREVEVMRLVGATNWFIRVPFVLEGLVQGLGGALVAGALVWVVEQLLSDLVNGSQAALLRPFVLTGGEVGTTIFVLAIAGILLGSSGSWLAIRRFLAEGR
jgi:cell division transport system permease protein